LASATCCMSHIRLPSSSNEPLKYLICSWHLKHGMFYVLWNSCQMRCQQS
jgi:hypothetical protein